MWCELKPRNHCDWCHLPSFLPWIFRADTGNYQSAHDREKTAFCPRPGMGLFKFLRMPFGLTGASSSFQRLMDNILRGLSFVTIYLDDILVHSMDEKMHYHHLNEVFQRLAAAGLTLRGRKCHIGFSHVTNLGHVITGSGMSPDPQKIEARVQWPQPTDATAVRQILGLARTGWACHHIR